MADFRHIRTPAGTDHSGSELQALHLSDVELELYSLNRLHPAFHPPMEEHLLWCKECAISVSDNCFDQTVQIG